MADVSRVEKLASARKKLKKFQKNKKSSGEVRKARGKSDSLEVASKLEQIHEEQDQESPQQLPDENQVSRLESTWNQDKTDTSNQSSETPNLFTIAEESQLNIPNEHFNSDLYFTNSNDNGLTNERQTNSSESLRQISMQLNGLMNDGENFLNGSIDTEENNTTTTQLEIRNQELASGLENRERKVLQLQTEIQQLKSRNQELQSQISKEREESEEKSLKEQGSLKEQLQVHIQTIGILVAEKTELQSALSQTQRTAKQKTGEVEELDGRLKALRQRVSDLDKELTALRSSKEQFENSSKTYSKEVDKLKVDIYKLNKSNEVLQNQVSELVEKLKVKTAENSKIEHDLLEANKKASLAELRVQQLSSSSDNDIQKQLEELNEKNIQLESKVSQYKDSFQKLSDERDSLTEQYQQYIQQLNQQITSVRDELSSLTDECKRLYVENQSLHEAADKAHNYTDNQSSSLEVEKAAEEVTLLKEMIKRLEDSHEHLKGQLDNQVADNSNLMQMIEAREEELQKVENTLSRFHEEEVDKEKLLDTIQSDKVAASRAMAQNKQLKKQLEELQEGFVQMSHDKLELTEAMMLEKHTNKELGLRFLHQEEELRALKMQVQEKDKELSRVSQDTYQQNQISDQMRHFEAQSQLSEVLQKELSHAQEQIAALSAQNSDLRSRLAQSSVSLQNGDVDSDSESRKDDLVASLSASVQQLELERDQLLRQLDNQKDKHRNLQNALENQKVAAINENVISNGGIVGNDENSSLRDTLWKLEERFKKTMGQVAELTEQKQQLEHLVMQLQGETETIGDYIALYQVQRGLMKKWASEKDDYISQLSRDRHELKSKLSQLQALVMNLVNKKQIESDQVSETLSLNSRSVSPEKPIQAGEWNLPNNIENENAIPAKDWDAESSISSDFIPTTISQYYPIDHQAKKIMDLISDIGNSTLGDKPVLDTFHPCSVCSGRLITV